MTRGAKIALIISSIVVVTTITTIIIVRSKRKKKKEEAEKQGLETDKKGEVTTISESVGADETTSQTKQQSTPPPLKIGSRGRYVGTIQMAVNFLYGAGIKVDGRFGSELRDALREHEYKWCLTQLSNSIDAMSSCNLSKEAYIAIHKKAKAKPGWSEYVKNNAGYKKVTEEYGK